MLTFSFSGAKGSMTVPETLTVGMVGKQAMLEFSREWEGLSKTVVFSNGAVTVDVVFTENPVTIPAKVLEKPLRRLTVGVFGVGEGGSVVIPTVRVDGPVILPGAALSGNPAAEEALPIWRQTLAAIGDMAALETEERDTLVDAVNQLVRDLARKTDLYYTPKVSEDGYLRWQNNCGAPNPAPVKIQGPAGRSAFDFARDAGYTGTEESFAAMLVAGGNGMEPGPADIPSVFFGGDLPQTKDDAVMSFRYISKTRDISCWCKTKAQGNSSMSYPKKNQTVKLYRDAECTEKLTVDFKGWGEQNKFCFKANWIDITHARNVVSARLWGDTVKSRESYDAVPELLRTSPNQGAVDGFPVKVYANGIYQGRYTINIPKDAWMANMDKNLDSHCILCGENYNSGCFRAEAKLDGSDWTDETHDTAPEAVKSRWNEAIRFVMNSTDAEFAAGIGVFFDVESLIDYYLFGLVSCGLDAFGKNQLYMTYDGQKWYATMYDMDSTWGLWWTGQSFVSATYSRNEFQDFKDGEGNLLYIRLESLFHDAIMRRWEVLKSGPLSVSSIISRFERFTDITPAELVKEDYAITTANGEFTGIPSVSANNIQQIRAYAVERLAWVETYLRGEPEVLYQLPEVTVLDGTNYIDTGVPLFDTAKDFTVFAAFDCPGVEAGTWAVLVGCGTAENDDNIPLLLGYDNGNAYPKLRTGGNANHSWEDVVTGAWGHGWINLGAVALVFVGGVFSFGRYLRKDNNAISYIKPAEGIAYIPDNRNCIIGGKTSFWSGNVGNFFKGTVKDFRIYGRALTEEELAALMTESAE